MANQGGIPSVSSILQNLRTPQGNPNNAVLQPIQHPTVKQSK